MKNITLHIGIVGAGGFARFAATAFSTIDGVLVQGIYDVNEHAAADMAGSFSAKVYNTYEELLHDENITLVYIATPPFLHYEQSRKALLAGKHVICEKPAALKATDASDLRDTAKTRGLLYIVNLMQRYNPLYNTVNQIIKQKILGNFLHGFFENYASDEYLDINHWFWDEKKSGGIFIEHGVHFFDMFSGWFGPGKVLNAIALHRPGTAAKIVDRVQATMLYDDAIVNIYHGFDQPKILDRQELRLQFERGDVTLYEWVPVQMKLYGLVTIEEMDILKEFCSGMLINVVMEHQPEHSAKGRFRHINYDKQIIAEAGSRDQKQQRYQEILIAMLTDQMKWIADRNHKRVIDADNAVESVRLAERATQLANNDIIQTNE